MIEKQEINIIELKILELEDKIMDLIEMANNYPKVNVPIIKRLISKRLIFQFLRFNIIGIIYTAITYLLFSFLIYIGVRYPIALVCDYSVGILLSFFLNKIFTFKVKGKASIKMFFRMLIGIRYVLKWQCIGDDMNYRGMVLTLSNGLSTALPPLLRTCV